jgi:replicative DNA helicase
MEFDKTIMLISACFLDKELVGLAVSYGINDDWFIKSEDRWAWKIIVELHKENKLNITEFVERFKDNDYVNTITNGWSLILAPRQDGMSAILALKHDFIRRKVKAVYQQGIKNLDSDDPIFSMKNTNNEIEKLLKTSEKQKEEDVLEIIKKDLDEGIVVPTGYRTLDWMTKGIQEGAMWVIGGSTSHGKTNFVLNIAWAVARSGYPVTICSTEMSERTLIQRLGTMISGVNPSIHQSLSDSEKNEFLQGCKEATELPINIIKTGSLAEIKLHVQRKTSILYIIDFIQMLSPDQKIDNDVRRLGYIVRELETMSKHYNTCIIATSQYSRPKDDGKPTLYRYRGSGEIEENTDIGIIMYYEFQDASFDKRQRLEGTPKENAINIGVQKNRMHGLTGNFTLSLNRENMIMSEIEREKENNEEN